MQAQAAATAAGASATDTPAEPEKPAVVVETPKVKAMEKGVVLLFGSTHYPELGKKIGSMLSSAATEATPDLKGPHRLLSGFGDISISFIATHCTSGHCVALGAGGEAFSWGRNDGGQLGLGDTKTRFGPERITTLKGKEITVASTGKMHSVFLTATGELFACGAGKTGAVGPAAKKGDSLTLTPIGVPVTAGTTTFKFVASGANFNLGRRSHPPARERVPRARACGGTG